MKLEEMGPARMHGFGSAGTYGYQTGLVFDPLRPVLFHWKDIERAWRNILRQENN